MKSYNTLNELIIKHGDDVREFVKSNIADVKINPNPDKITINCPYCGDNRKRYKLLINIDTGFFKCFRCGESGSLLKLFNHLGIKQEFIELISSLSNITQFNLSNLFKTAIANKHANVEDDTDKDSKIAAEFINRNGLLPIKQLPNAYKYALSRTYNNKTEVESYYADDKYIYIPIVTDEKLVSYMARLYINVDNAPRYIIHPILKNVTQIGFYDEVISNISTNSIYITEGYFDSLAINHAMSNYVSICTFGKGKIISVIEAMHEVFPNNTKIYLTFDSPVKDKDIIKQNISFGKKIIKYFPNLYIIELPDLDPSDVLAQQGSLALRGILTDCAIPFLKYLVKHSLKF